MNLVRILISVTMFSASARAFSLASTRARPAARLPFTLARMSTGGEAETSIVDVCTQKIEAALGPDKVEVTGEPDTVDNFSTSTCTCYYRAIFGWPSLSRYCILNHFCGYLIV